MDQLNQILHYLGTPDEQTLSRIGSPRAQEYVRNLPHMAKVNFAALFRNANPDALHLLDRMLAFDPSQRIGVEAALEHRYLHIWHDPSDEPDCPQTFDFTFEVVEEVPEMRRMILDEVRRFRREVRAQPNAQAIQMQAQQGGAQGMQQQAMGAMPQGQNGVPIPDRYDPRAYEDPRPEQLSAGGMNMGLEEELQMGLDAHMR